MLHLLRSGSYTEVACVFILVTYLGVLLASPCAI